MTEEHGNRDADGGGFLARAALRRRLRVLERRKELELRDVGGLVFELHRAGRSDQRLVDAKLETLDATDTELRNLREALDIEGHVIELREAGIASCSSCGELMGSTDRFCASCGAAAR